MQMSPRKLEFGTSILQIIGNITIFGLRLPHERDLWPISEDKCRKNDRL